MIYQLAVVNIYTNTKFYSLYLINFSKTKPEAVQLLFGLDAFIIRIHNDT